MVAKWQPSPLEDKQHKRAKTPPQPDLEDAPSRENPQTSDAGRNRWAEGEHGHSKTRRSDDRQKDLEKACSKSRARSKSKACIESRKQSKSRCIAKVECRMRQKAKHTKSGVG